MNVDLMLSSHPDIMHVFQKQWYACILSRFSHVQLCETVWTVAHQSPLSMGFSRQEYWRGLL